MRIVVIPAPRWRTSNASTGLINRVHERYVNYVTSALQLDFGKSFAVAGNPPVTELIARIWPVTFQLGLYTIILSFGLGISMGIVAAYYHNGIVDNLVTFVATTGIAVPNFIIATWLLLIFGFQNGWGAESKWIIGPVSADGAALLSWDYFLPVITYSLAPLAIVSRYTRSSFADVLTADFVRTARSKGLSERVILLRHVFKNALIPMITVLLPQIPNLLTGSLFIEVVYGVPGLGQVLRHQHIQSRLSDDYGPGFAHRVALGLDLPDHGHPLHCS